MKLTVAAGNSKATYKIVNNLLDKEYGSNKLPNEPSREKLAEDLKTFFHDKVKNIYEDIKSKIPSETRPTVSLDGEHTDIGKSPFLKSFKLFTPSDIAEVISSLGTKSCPSDPIPTWLMKNCKEELLPIPNHINCKCIPPVWHFPRSTQVSNRATCSKET